LFDSSFGQICQNQQRPRKTRAAFAGKCAALDVDSGVCLQTLAKKKISPSICASANKIL